MFSEAYLVIERNKEKQSSPDNEKNTGMIRAEDVKNEPEENISNSIPSTSGASSINERRWDSLNKEIKTEPNGRPGEDYSTTILQESRKSQKLMKEKRSALETTVPSISTSSST
ncbi:hypothetical protein CRE_04909 [Caenorhabditis remanei]|uniref:Uncharacterized protein n=1 Tax=Caenorhabditis remanei TaxID=31234 RepID=E3MN96_CAERE|nr:hypothetical protein CRE_04909 [Caenorhabditis remanei]